MEIINSIKFKGVEHVRVIISEIKERQKDEVTRLEIYFDIVDYDPVPIVTVLDNLKNYLGSAEDVFHYWPIDDLNDGIERIKIFCASEGLIFSEELEQRLRRGANNHPRLYLVVIERPFY